MLLCGQAGKSFGYPHLSQPFSIDGLLAASLHEIAHADANVIRVTAAAARLEASSPTVAERMDVSRRLLGRGRPYPSRWP